MTDTTRTARGLVDLAGGNPRLYVPGSLRVHLGGHLDWTEKCSPRCRHDDGGCHMARSANLPTGYIDEESR